MSQDVQHSPPKGWKAFQVNYDYVFEQADRLCSVCLTQQEITALLSMTEYLYWPTRWVKAADDVNRSIVEHFAQNLERHLLMSCCDDNIPIQYRYGSDGILERSTNAGGSWVNCPEYDPRVYSPQFPPMTGDDGTDKKCLAATGAAALVKEQVGDQLTDGMSRYTLSQLITDWVATMIQSSNPFQALLTVVANQIFALIIAVLRPALTESVYDTFKCILFCRMANDATFNQSRWENVRSDITTLIGGIAGVFLEHLVFLLGTTGLSNLARAGGAAEGDCEDCDACPSNCDPSGWRTGLYYDGSWHTPRGGTIVETGPDYVIVESQDRGDGQTEIALSVADVTTCCLVQWANEGEAPSSTLHFYSLCPLSADITNWVQNDLMPTCNDVTSYYFQMEPGTWRMRFTFVDVCP
jgi:hypothetical protein